jgi:hypothetical protein
MNKEVALNIFPKLQVVVLRVRVYIKVDTSCYRELFANHIERILFVKT